MNVSDADLSLIVSQMIEQNDVAGMNEFMTNAMSHFSSRILSECIRSRRYNMISLCIQKGANVNYRNTGSDSDVAKTIFCQLFLDNALRVVQYSVHRGRGSRRNVTTTVVQDRTISMLLALEGNLKPDVNVDNNFPLKQAYLNQRFSLALLLIENGASGYFILPHLGINYIRGGRIAQTIGDDEINIRLINATFDRQRYPIISTETIETNQGLQEIEIVITEEEALERVFDTTFAYFDTHMNEYDRERAEFFTNRILIMNGLSVAYVNQTRPGLLQFRRLGLQTPPGSP